MKKTICVDHTFIVLENIHVMTDVPYTLISDSFYNKELIQYLISLDWGVVLAYYSIPGPESDLHLSRFFFTGEFIKN